MSLLDDNRNRGLIFAPKSNNLDLKINTHNMLANGIMEDLLSDVRNLVLLVLIEDHSRGR